MRCLSTAGHSSFNVLIEGLVLVKGSISLDAGIFMTITIPMLAGAAPLLSHEEEGCAISDHKGSFKFYTNPDNKADNRLYPKGLCKEAEDGETDAQDAF